MTHYMENAKRLQKDIYDFVEEHITVDDQFDSAIIALGHIVNSAVLCNPRKPQGTVHKNIVAEAVKGYCNVTMTRETDPESGKEYNKIHISAKE